jgi:hypothetical protein
MTNDETTPDLYHVIVSAGSVNVLVTVSWDEPTPENPREFKFVKIDSVTMTGFDSHRNISTGAKVETPYPQPGTPLNPKEDLSLVSELFKEQIAELGIRLNDINAHALDSFETISCDFVDPVKKQYIFDLIDEACKKQIINFE